MNYEIELRHRAHASTDDELLQLVAHTDGWRRGASGRALPGVLSTAVVWQKRADHNANHARSSFARTLRSGLRERPRWTVDSVRCNTSKDLRFESGWCPLNPVPRVIRGTGLSGHQPLSK